jgi:hypothetical protein
MRYSLKQTLQLIQEGNRDRHNNLIKKANKNNILKYKKAVNMLQQGKHDLLPPVVIFVFPFLFPQSTSFNPLVLFDLEVSGDLSVI